MSHDCDCWDCQQTDSRWAPHRATQKALKDDCPKGIHVASLWRSYGSGSGLATEYRCRHCAVPVTAGGFALAHIAKKTAVSKKPTAICQTHKRYLAKRKPKTTCEDCWRAWIKKEK